MAPVVASSAARGYQDPVPMAPALGFTSPLNPTLEYKYPPPNAMILRNIGKGAVSWCCNARVSVCFVCT